MRSLLPRAAIASLALALMASGAFAQGVVDQQNDPSGGSGFGAATEPRLHSGQLVLQGGLVLALRHRVLCGRPRQCSQHVGQQLRRFVEAVLLTDR